MFRVSGPDLVIAAARAGAVGAFPTLNARTPPPTSTRARPDRARHRRRFRRARREPDSARVERAPRRGPARRVRHRVPVVIASVGAPDPVIGPCTTTAASCSPTSRPCATRAARPAAGADGLVLLTGGRAATPGGSTRWRSWPRCGRSSTGSSRSRAASPRPPAACAAGRGRRPRLRRHAVRGDPREPRRRCVQGRIVAAGADDIVVTDAVTGIPASFVKGRLQELGYLDERGVPGPRARSTSRAGSRAPGAPARAPAGCATCAARPSASSGSGAVRGERRGGTALSARPRPRDRGSNERARRSGRLAVLVDELVQARRGHAARQPLAFAKNRVGVPVTFSLRPSSRPSRPGCRRCPCCPAPCPGASGRSSLDAVRGDPRAARLVLGVGREIGSVKV